MPNKLEAAVVRRLAKLYRRIHPDMSIGKAVYIAHEAYDLYKVAEFDTIDAYYERNPHEISI